MSKKSAKEKNSTKEESQPTTSKKKTNYISDLYVYAGLILLFLFSFYLRVIKPMSRVFVGDTIHFDGNDPWYHMMLAKSTVINHQRLWFDPLTNFPQGTSIHFGPFNSWGIAIFSYIAGLGSPSIHTVEVVGALFPAILGAFLVFPVYFIGREIGGRKGGIMAAIMIAVLPGQILTRSLIGFSDHHVAETLLSTTALLFFLLAIQTGQNKLSFRVLSKKGWTTLKKPLTYSVLAGFFLGLYIDAWSSGHLFIGILLIFATVQSIVDHLRGRNIEYLGITGAITFVVALLMILPFVRIDNGFSTSLYSLFQPTMLILGALFVLLLSFVSTLLTQKEMKRYYFPTLVVGTIAVGLFVLFAVASQFMGPLMSGLHIFAPKTGGSATVSEISPIMARGAVQMNFPGLLSFLSPFWLVFLALALILYRYWEEFRNTDMLIFVWTVIILTLTLAQNRFAYYYAANVALLVGLLGSTLLEETKFEKFEDTLMGMAKGRSIQKIDLSNVVLNVLAVVALVLLFIIPSMFGTLGGERVGSWYSERYVGGSPNSDWYDSMLWLRDNTPDPNMDIYAIYEKPPKGEKFPYPETAYGVMSWWDYGHWIEAIGHRMPNANPFQQGIGNKVTGKPGSSPFFLAQDENEAENVLEELDENRSSYSNTRYVITDVEMAMGKFHAIAAWSNDPVNKYYGAIPQGKQYVQVYTPQYFKTMIARLHFFDGTETPIGDAWAVSFRPDGGGGVMVEPLKISRNYSDLQETVNESFSQGYPAAIVSQSPASTAVPLEALKHYRLVHESQSPVTSDGQKYVKIFEHVPGAEITGSAPSGTKVTISVPIMTNQNRTFLYKQSTVSDGEFSLVVPYSTEGPASWSTKFDTGPLGPYRLIVGDEMYDVRIPEEMVMSKGSMRV
ncbi:MAG: oligosaccharyl transferase, archaeosortase A system-associated [Methanotrichaceae archaeon]